jgi:hypothetical protein
VKGFLSLFVSRCLAAMLLVACCLLPARAQQPASPQAAGLPDGIAAEIAGLQAQIDSLRAEKAAAKPELPKARGADGVPGSHERPSLKLSGQVQADTVYFGQDPVSQDAVGDLQDGSQFRRVRLVARGKTWKQLEYALGVDFALANQPAFLDNYIEAHDLPWVQNVRVGHFFEPFSLERVTQNRNNTFMERSLVDTFAPARNMGAMTFGWAENERATWQIGTFRTNSDNVGNDSFDSGQALTMRGTWLPFWDDATDGRSYLHLGVAYSYRDADNDRVRFRNTPEIRKARTTAPRATPARPPSPRSSSIPASSRRTRSSSSIPSSRSSSGRSRCNPNTPSRSSTRSTDRSCSSTATWPSSAGFSPARAAPTTATWASTRGWT